MHNFSRASDSSLDIKVTIFFNVKYLENDTRYCCTCNGRLVGADMDVGWVHPWVGLGWVGINGLNYNDSTHVHIVAIVTSQSQRKTWITRDFNINVPASETDGGLLAYAQLTIQYCQQ